MILDNFIAGKENIINTQWQQPSIEKEKMLSLYKDGNVINLDSTANYIKKKRIDNVEFINEDNQQDQLLFYYEQDSGYDPIGFYLPIGIEKITSIEDNKEENKFYIKGINNNKTEEEILFEGLLSEANDMNIIIDEDGTINFNYNSGLVKKQYFTKEGTASTGYGGDFCINSKMSISVVTGTATTQYGLGRINPTTHTTNYLNNYLIRFMAGKGRKNKIINNFSWYDCKLVNCGSGQFAVSSMTPIRKTGEDIEIPSYLYGFDIRYIGDLEFEQTNVNNLILGTNILEKHYSFNRVNAAFSNLNINTVKYLNSTYFGSRSFKDCVINNLELNKTSLNVGYEAFYGCSGNFLKDIPWATTTFNSYPFSLCTFEKIELDNLINFYGYNNSFIFAECIKLNTVNLPNLTDLVRGIFFNCSKLENINLPLITNIPQQAFANCTNLTGENIIFSSDLTTVYINAFENCTSLRTLDFLNSNKNITLNNYAFKGCTNLQELILPPSITTLKNYVFQNCTNLISINLSNVTTIGQYDFDGCTKLTNVIAPFTTSLATYSFYQCSALSNVDLPLVKSIGSWSFYNCGTIDTLNLPKITSIPSNCFTYTYIKNADFRALTSLNYLPDKTYFENLNIASITSLSANYFQNCTNLKSIDISSVATIPTYCFDKCTNLTNVVVTGATSIGDYAFHECRALTSISLPKVTTVSVQCFRYCVSLADVSIPNLTNINDYGFIFCESLSNIDLTNVTHIGKSAFKFCYKLEEVIAPNLTSLSTSGHMFNTCSVLKKVSFPKLTSLVGAQIFYANVQLKEVYLPKVTIISGSNMFYNCPALEIIDIASYAGAFPNTAFSDTEYNNFKEITNSKLTSMSGIVVANDFSLSNNQGLLNNFELASTGKIIINSLINTTSTTISLANATDITINNLNEEDTLGIVNLTLNENATALDINLKGIEPETMAAMITSNCTELRNYNYWTPLYLQSSTMVPFLSTGTYATPTATETYIELGEINEEGYMTGSIYTKYKNKVIYIPSTLEAEYLTQEYFSNLVPDVQHGYFTTQNTETGEWTDFVLVSTEKSTVKEDYGFGIITI